MLLADKVLSSTITHEEVSNRKVLWPVECLDDALLSFILFLVERSGKDEQCSRRLLDG